MPVDPRIRVFRSPIHGYGVLARRHIAQGEVIAEVDGVLYREDELEDDRYCLWICDGFYFDMVDQTCWINHSCEPNAEIEADLDERNGAWARVVARKSIQVGEEITYDYAFPQELAEPCACGTRNCRAWIVDANELGALQERLAAERGGEAGRDGDAPAAGATTKEPGRSSLWQPSRARQTLA